MLNCHGWVQTWDSPHTAKLLTPHHCKIPQMLRPQGAPGTQTFQPSKGNCCPQPHKQFLEWNCSAAACPPWVVLIRSTHGTACSCSLDSLTASSQTITTPSFRCHWLPPSLPMTHSTAVTPQHTPLGRHGHAFWWIQNTAKSEAARSQDLHMFS